MTSTQEFLPIADISSDLVFLKNGGVSLIISTSAVNFGLLFDTEQISLIQSFAGLLNSLSFPIQIVIHSRRLDVSSYLLTLDKAMAYQTNPQLKMMTKRYREYVAGIIKTNNVLDKQFYVCLNVSSIELGVLHKNPQERGKRATTVLSPRRDHLIRQLNQLGLKAKQLNTVELVKLFYVIYNPPYNDPPMEGTGTTTPPSPQTKISPPVPSPQTATSIPYQNLQTMNVPRHDPLPSTPATPPISAAPQAPPAGPSPSSTSPLTPPFIVEELNDE